jgi:hypothetical protein
MILFFAGLAFSLTLWMRLGHFSVMVEYCWMWWGIVNMCRLGYFEWMNDIWWILKKYKYAYDVGKVWTPKMITYFRLFFDTESLGILCSGHYVIQLDKEYRKRIAYICESDDETNCVTRYHVLCGFSVPKLIWKPCQKQKKKKRSTATMVIQQ